MVVRLKDGTQEYISNVEKLVDIVEDRLGHEFKLVLMDYMNGEYAEDQEDLKDRYNDLVTKIEELYHEFDLEE